MIFKTKIIFNTAILVLLVSISKMDAQNQTLEKNKASKFEYLLHEKRKIYPAITLDDSYKIQIFSGNSDAAKKNLSLFRQEFKNIEATIVFNTPNYKVWVGSFKTRLDAERNMIEIRKKFPNLLLIKPNR